MENNNDFKHIIQDTSHIYLGKELTYGEILTREEAPFKFKAMINAYVLKDIGSDAKLSEHMLSIQPENFSYLLLEQLKLEIRILYKEEKKGFGGKTKERWVHKACTLKEFSPKYRDAVLQEKAVIEDISISKLALMMINI